MPVERSFDHRHIIPEELSLASDFIRKTVYETGFAQHRLFVALRDASALSGGIISRANDQAFETYDIERLDHILPHLGRAMRMRHQLARHRASAQSLLGLLDQMETAVFLLDRNCQVLFRNSCAEELLGGRAGVSVSRGRLSLGRRDDPSLMNAIMRVADLGAASDDPPVIPIRDGLDGLSLFARVFPGTGYADVPGASRVAAALLIDVAALSRSSPDIDVLRDVFGLTRAEALVAQRVPSGATRRGIADSLGLSPNTVKTHLAAIRAKTGAGSQVALAQMLQRTAG